MAVGDAAGFWSYTHQDNELDGGRILRLAERLRAEFALLTGAELELFIDRDGIEWGDAWRARIDEALAGTTFFIPMITPRYFARPECRRELLAFIGHAKSLGLEELLLPILYVQVPELEGEESPADEAMAVVAATQWVDWRRLRLVDEDSSEYRQAVNRLATRLVEISERIAERPETLPPPAVATAAGHEEDDEPGLVDLVAAGEEAMPRWQAVVEQFPPLLEEVGRIASDANEEMAASDQRGGGFAGRLTVAQRLAAALEEPAERLAELGSSYASELVQIDPAILALIRAVEEDPSQASTQDTRQLFDSIQGLAAASRETAEAMAELSRILSQTATLSRALRRPIRRIQEGLRGILDGQSVIDEWDERIRRVRESIESIEADGGSPAEGGRRPPAGRP